MVTEFQVVLFPNFFQDSYLAQHIPNVIKAK